LAVTAARDMKLETCGIEITLRFDRTWHVGKPILRKLNIERLGQPAFICLWLALVTLLVYMPVFQAQFIGFDDDEYVFANPHVLSGISLANLRWAFVTNHAANWHPVTWISLMLNSQYLGRSAGAFHAINLLLHIANTLLLFLWLYGTTGAKWRGALVAALFALHPLHVESVAWISERKDVLSTLFWILTLIVYTDYAKTDRISRYFFALLLFVIGLMAKPMLVTLPFVLLLLDYWPLGRFEARRTFRLLIEKLPFLAFSIASSIVTVVAQHGVHAIAPLDLAPIFVRAQNATVAYMAYIGKLFRPIDLAVFYPYNRHPSLLLAFLALAALVIVSAAAILIRRHKPYVLTGWFWFLITLVPVIGIVQVGLQSMADRYTYIPFIGLFIILAWGGWDALNRLRIPRFVQALAASIALLLCAGLTRAQLRYWNDSVALFQHAVNLTVGDGAAAANLGYALAEQGQHEKAIGYYKAVLRSHPRGDATVWNNFGASLAATGKLEEAIDAFQNALKLDPSMGDAHENIGLALVRSEKQQESLIHFRDAARLKPENARIHNIYAVMLGEAGRTDEAMQEFQTALRLAPSSAATHANLANLLAKQHARDEAMAHYSEALRLDPAFVEAHSNIASLLLEVGRTDDAAAHYIAALLSKPDYVPAMVGLAWVYATASGEAGSQYAAEAVRLAEQACRISGCKESGELDTLAAAYANAGRFEEAIKTDEEAFSIAKAAGENDFADSIRARIDLYKKGSPFRAPQ
jgi:tetratricopeptide (TPR) repeat protein